MKGMLKMCKKVFTCLFFACLITGASAEEVLVIPSPSAKSFNLTDYSSSEISAICNEAKSARSAKDFDKSNSLLDDAAKKSAPEDAAKIHNLMGLAYVDQNNYDAAEKHWQFVANRIPRASEAQVGYAKLRLAYVKLHNQKKEAACEAFREIALGFVPADNATAVDASQRYARMLQTKGELVEAMDLYKQLIASPNVPDKNKIEAKVELAGVLWEIGKGDYSFAVKEMDKSMCMLESRKVCEELIATPGIPEDKLVIAELINVETYYFQKDYATTEKLSEAFLAKWSSLLNADGKTLKYQLQVAAARGWEFLSAYRQGKIDKTLELCTKLVDNPDMCKSYNNFLVHAVAMHYKAMCLEDKGESAKAAETRRAFEEKYPNYAQYSAKSDEEKLAEIKKGWKS